MSDSSRRRVVGTPSTASATISTPPGGSVSRASPSVRPSQKASQQPFPSAGTSARHHHHHQQQQQQRNGASGSPVGTPIRAASTSTTVNSNLRARLQSHTATDDARSHAARAFHSPSSSLTPAVTPIAISSLSATHARSRTIPSAPLTESPTVRVRPPLASHASSTVSPASPKRRVFVATSSNAASHLAGDGSPAGPSYSLPRSVAATASRPTLARSTFASSRSEPIKASISGRPANASSSPAAATKPFIASPSLSTSRNIFNIAAESPVSSAQNLSLTASRPGSPIRRPFSPVRPTSPSKIPTSTSGPIPAVQSETIHAQPSSPARPVRPALCISPQRQPSVLSTQPARHAATSPPLSPKTSRPSASSQSSYTTSASRSDAASLSSATTNSPDPQHDLAKSASQASFATIQLPPSSPLVATRHMRSQSQTSDFSTLSGSDLYKQSISTAQREIGIRIPASTTFADLASSPPKMGISLAVASYTKQQADAKVKRKILDLEITNTSLLAINASLEKAKVKQAQELRELRRTLRDCTIGPSSGSLLSPMSDMSAWPRLEADVEDDVSWEDILAHDQPFAEAVRAIEAMTQHAKTALEKSCASETVQIGGRVLNQYNLSRSQLSIPGDTTDFSRRTSSASELDSMMVHKPDISMVSSIGID